MEDMHIAITPKIRVILREFCGYLEGPDEGVRAQLSGVVHLQNKTRKVSHILSMYS